MIPRVLVTHLREAYEPEAANLCSRISNILRPSKDDVGDIGEPHAISFRDLASVYYFLQTMQGERYPSWAGSSMSSRRPRLSFRR